MGHSLRIDEDRLHSLTREYESLGDLARRAQEDLKTVVAEEGEFWGNDEPGRHFEKTYRPDSQRVLDSLAKTVQSLVEEGNLVNGIARNLGDADRDGFATIREAVALHDRTPATSVPATIDATPPAPTGVTAQPIADQITPASTTVTPDHSLATPPAPTAAADPTATPPDISNTAADDFPSAEKPANRPGSPDDPHATEPTAAENGAPTAEDRPLGGAAPATTAGQNIAGTPPAATRTPDRAAVTSPTRAQTAKPDNPGATERQRPSTPWSRSAAPAGPPSKVSAPATDPGGARPPSPPPPQAKRKDKRDNREAVPANAAHDATGQTESEHAAERASQFLVQALAARHELRVVGLDAPGITPDVRHEIAVALDDVLTEHPYLALGEFVIGDCGEDVTRLEWGEVPGEHGPQTQIRQLTLHHAVACRPGLYAEKVRAAAAAGASVRGIEERPVYCAIVRELGHALDILGGLRARRVAQRKLIAGYLALRGADLYTETLGSVVHGYRQWRGSGSGGDSPNSGFDPGPALADAFVQVQLHRKEAATPAHILRRLLVETAKP
ncbi:hypothetical protein IU448_15835 [Nocardia flavorosea]|uniref:hypothetical protein n=1 Tax=Nocardia flavorosea TaxID=53429 RepID=UPI00189405E7|nr:hypothetical protein [Nocardia flavorosea]MBF6350474.1 hypothetical protein [Nocardia flavorosea]